MTDIVAGVLRVQQIIGSIATAASQQADGVAHINAAISSLDRMTQQNAALVEESAAAAGSLKDQADSLSSALRAFKAPWISWPRADVASVQAKMLRQA